MENDSFVVVRLCALKTNKKKKKQSRIADCILSDMENADRFTIESLAEKTDTSYATVCRFFKELGVSGIKDFKRIILLEMKKQQKLGLKLENYSIENQEEFSFRVISGKVCDFSASAVDNCLYALKDEQIGQIIHYLSKADFVYFVGLGTSAVTALYAYTKMFRLKLNCSFDTDVIISKMKASVMRKSDVLFVISSSGRTKSIIETAKIAKQNGVTVITLCDYLQSPLAEISDINICTTARDSNKYLDMDFPLIQGQITIIDIIYSCMYNQKKVSAAVRVDKTANAVKEDKIL